MKLFDDSLLDELTARARSSPRRRAHFNIHAAATEPVQRFFVVANADSYFRPHQHLTKAELAILLRGRVDILIFDETGRLLARDPIGEGTGRFAYEMVPGTWHTLVPLMDGCAFLEVKEGPYDPARAVHFASWAPEEGAEAVEPFQQWLRTAAPGSIFEQ